MKDGEITEVPLASVAGKQKLVDPEGDVVHAARELGICFGDVACVEF